MLNPVNSPLEIPALHELEMVSPWFDASAPRTPTATPRPQPAEPETRQLLVVLSIPRCGSYHLCRLLWQLGYGKPAEYFNPSLQPLLARFHPEAKHRYQRVLYRTKQRLQPHHPTPQWLEGLVQERTSTSTITGQPWFAAKLQPDQLGSLPQALNRVFEPLARKGYWKPFHIKPPALVMLYRRDWTAMVLSHHLARCSGSFDQRRIFTHQHRSITQLGAEQALLEDLSCAKRHLEALTHTLETSLYPIHLTDFESLLSQQTHMLATLISRIDPYSPPPADLGNSPKLQFKIARTPDPWASDLATWQQHLHSRFQELNLHKHPDSLACQALITQLDSYLPSEGS